MVKNITKEEFDKEQKLIHKLFPITSLSRRDILDMLSRKGIKLTTKITNKVLAITDREMEGIASKMADAYCDCCFWIVLADLVRLGEPKVHQRKSK